MVKPQLYLSRGNVPSTWTHALQGMRMAEAFAGILPGLQLVTQVHPDLAAEAFDFAGWYGLRRSFPIVRLPSPEPDLPRCPLIDGWRFPKFDRAAVAYARQVGAGLVYTRSTLAARYAVEAGLATLVETHVGPRGLQGRPLRKVARSPHFLGLVTVSELVREEYLRFGIPDGQILVWPDAVDLGAFDGLPPSTTLRQQLGLPAEGCVATYCGHLYEGRGIEEILTAAASLPDVHFVVVGGTPDKVTSWRQAASGLANVRFEGHVRHPLVPLYLGASDLLLLPYSASCSTAAWMSPLKLFESMAAARAIIASDLPALRLHLRDGANAVLVPPDDAPSLARAITGLRDDPARRQELGEQARRDVAPLTWDLRAEAIADHFQLDRSASAAA